MRNRVRIFSIISAVLLTVSMFAGCTSKEKNTSENLTKIRLNEVVRSIFYAPMYVAINQGFFKEQGLDIELTTGQGADKTMQQVLSKNAEIGFCGPEQVIYLYNQGKEDHGVIFAGLTKRDGSFLVGKNNDAGFKWESLRGKTVIGGRPGGVPEMSLEYVLKNHGLTPGKDVNLITNLAFTATAGAFKSGTGDYVALFEPTATKLEQENAGYIVASVGKSSGEMPYTSFFATKSYIENNPEIIQKFTNAVYKGLLWTQSHSSDEIAAQIETFFPGFDSKTMSKVIDRYKSQDSWAKNPILKEDQLSRLEDVIQSYNPSLIPSRPPFNKIVTNKFADDAVKNIK